MSPPASKPADVGNRRRKMRRGIVRATTSGLNLAIVGAGGLGGLALGSWPIFALGGAAYAALVAWDLSNPKFWAKVLGGVQPTAELATLPQPMQLASPELRRLGQQILAARAELARVMEATPEAVAEHLVGTCFTARELEGRAAVLLGRGDALYGYLSRAGLDEVRAAVADLAQRVRATRDDEARAQYQSALEARQDHLHTLEQIVDAHSRSVAHLTRLGALLSALPAKVVHVRTLDAEAMDKVSGDMKQELESFNVEIASFEETLKTLAEVATP